MADDLPPPLTPPEPPPVGPPASSSDETVMLVLCYIGLLALIPYLVAKEVPIIRWHARQGLALALVGLACVGIALIPYLGFVGHLGLAGVLVLSIIGVVKALDRAQWRMPVAADVADRLEL